MALVNKTFSDIITFTRASTATFFNSAGVLTSAATNAPRFDYNPSTLAAQGLLIEEARTNALTYSAEFDNAAWTKTRSSITANATTSPDGTVNADKLVEDTTASASHPLISAVLTVVVGSTQSFSVYAKAAERSAIVLRLNAASDSIFASFNLSTGAVGTTVNAGTGSGATATIQNAGNGWYRCTLSGIFSSTSANPIAIIYPAVSTADPSGTSIVYTGNGTSGLFIWGAQLEAGAFPTSYIPTTTTALTRAADVASVNTLSPWYNSVEGTLYGEFAVAGYAPTSSFSIPAVLSDNTNNNVISVANTNTGANLYSYGEINTGGVSQAGFYGASGLSFGVGSVRKSAIAYAANNFAFTTQGAAVQTDTSGTVPTVSRLYVGVGATGGSLFLNGYLRRVSYYPTRLSNAQLQAITA